MNQKAAKTKFGEKLDSLQNNLILANMADAEKLDSSLKSYFLYTWQYKAK